MIKLTANNGEEIHEIKDIIKEVKTLYERLYSDRQVDECEISDLVRGHTYFDITGRDLT